MYSEIISHPFNAWERLQSYENTLTHQGKWGAVATFIGTMRDEEKTVQAMFLEHYPGMTEKYLRQISQTALQRWELIDTLILHRVGEILPGETIVLVASWAGHRAPAFEACRYLIEELKHHAPFWKKEILHGTSRWVEKNTPATYEVI